MRSALWPQLVSTTPDSPTQSLISRKYSAASRFNGAGWAQVNCCFHGPDREPCLSLHRGGGFNCFACGAHGGDILEFEHLRTGRDRRAIAQDWGAWSGRPIFERPRPAWARPAPRPVIVKDPAEKPKLTAEFFEAARLNFEAIKAEAHRLCDRGCSVHALDGKIPRGNGWQNAPRKTHDDIERHFQPRLFDGVMSYPNLGFRIDAGAGRRRAQYRHRRRHPHR